MYDNKSIDVVDDINYLRITLNFNVNFHKTQNVLVSQSKTSLCSLILKTQPL